MTNMKYTSLLFIPFLLASCAIEHPDLLSMKPSVSNFVSGRCATLPLSQINNSPATVDEILYITKNFLFDGSKLEFVSTRTAGYNPLVLTGSTATGASSLMNYTGLSYTNPLIQRMVKDTNATPDYVFLKGSPRNVIFLFNKKGKLVTAEADGGPINTTIPVDAPEQTGRMIYSQ